VPDYPEMESEMQVLLKKDALIKLAHEYIRTKSLTATSLDDDNVEVILDENNEAVTVIFKNIKPL
jgi:hypothetical protein